MVKDECEIHKALTICDRTLETSKRRSRVNMQRNACFTDAMILWGFLT